MRHEMVLGDIELAGVFMILFVICVAVSQALEHTDTNVPDHVCTQLCANADTAEECPAIANLANFRRRYIEQWHSQTQTEAFGMISELPG